MQTRYTRHILVLAGSMLACALPAAAQRFAVVVNNRAVDTGNQAPVEVNGHVLVPLASIGRAMGAYMEWRPATRSVYGEGNGHTFRLPIDSRTAIVDDRSQLLETPAMLMNGHTMVPLRFVATALGADVRYEPGTRTVFVGNVDTGTTRVAASEPVDDTQPPVFDRVTPTPGTRVGRRDVQIHARWTDPGGSGVDPASVRLFVNGVDVTRRTTVSRSGLAYDARLDPGLEHVRITLRDRAGNAAETGWDFRVRPSVGAAAEEGYSGTQSVYTDGSGDPAIWPADPPVEPTR